MPRRPLRPNEISSGAVVVRRSATGFEVCLVSDGRHWGFPKGLLEAGETPEDAALREISEETGIARQDLIVAGALPVSEYVYRRPNRGALAFKRVHHVLVEAPPGTALRPDPAEIAEAGWFGIDDARTRLTFKSAVEVLDAAAAMLAREGTDVAP
jgi:8-oxo-dGTP pyrophosphatase MutT (NUDIX family)